MHLGFGIFCFPDTWRNGAVIREKVVIEDYEERTHRQPTLRQRARNDERTDQGWRAYCITAYALFRNQFNAQTAPESVRENVK